MAGISIADAKLEPDKYQVCKNGVIRDRTTGRFCAAGQITTAITPSNSHLMYERRQEIWHDSFNAGMASKHNGMQELAIQAIGKNITAIATKHGGGMPAVKAAAEVARLGGWVERRQGAAGTTVNIINVVEGAGAADLLREVRDIDVIDME